MFSEVLIKVSSFLFDCLKGQFFDAFAKENIHRDSWTLQRM